MDFRQLDRGELVAVLGGLLILVGTAWRAQDSATTGKPPGLP
jgi:hypothetical protein